MHEHTYSEALYEAIAGGMKPDAALKRLKDILSARGHRALYPKILASVLVRFRESERSKILEVIVAREGDEKKFKETVKALKDGASETKIRVEGSLIGGFIARTGGKEIDQSHKTALLKIYRSLTA